MLDVVEVYVSRRKVKFNSRMRKVMVVGKREAGVSWKIGEEIVEEVEKFKHLGVDGVQPILPYFLLWSVCESCPIVHCSSCPIPSCGLSVDLV